MQHTGCSLARACDQMHPRGFNLLPGEFYYILISKQCLLLCYTFPWPITLGWVKPLRKRMRLSFSLIKLSRCFIQLVYMSNQFLRINWNWNWSYDQLKSTCLRQPTHGLIVVTYQWFLKQSIYRIYAQCLAYMQVIYCEVDIASYAS
jgi:hypothetical protein